jgi:hypothetical protein
VVFASIGKSACRSYESYEFGVGESGGTAGSLFAIVATLLTAIIPPSAQLRQKRPPGLPLSALRKGLFAYSAENRLKVYDGAETLI